MYIIYVLALLCPIHCAVCSFDIKSLYTSCNMKHAQRIVKTKLHDHPSLLPSNISPTAFDTLISFCLDNSYFEYNNKFFAQNSGDRHNISLTFTSNRNLRNMLTKTKTQPPPHTFRNVIYQIPCKDCNATYCGQTRRPLHLRLSEHQRFTNNSKSFTSTDLQYTSAVAHHAHTTGHTIDFKSTHISFITHKI